MIDWIVVVVIGAGTYLIRLSFIAILARTGIPPALERPLRYVAPAVFAAIIVPPILVPEGDLDISADNLEIYAAIAAGLVAWRTRNIAWTIVVGLVVLNLLDFLV